MVEGGYDLVTAEMGSAEEHLMGLGAVWLAKVKRGLSAVLRSDAEAPPIFLTKERAEALGRHLKDSASGEHDLLSLARARRHRVAELISPASR